MIPENDHCLWVRRRKQLFWYVREVYFSLKDLLKFGQSSQNIKCLGITVMIAFPSHVYYGVLSVPVRV